MYTVRECVRVCVCVLLAVRKYKNTENTKYPQYANYLLYIKLCLILLRFFILEKYYIYEKKDIILCLNNPEWTLY